MRIIYSQSRKENLTTIYSYIRYKTVVENVWMYHYQALYSIFFFPANALIKPKPPTATSIPAILKSLQDEWVC